MSNSSLASFTLLSPYNHSGKRTSKIQYIVLHHMAAVWTARRCLESFVPVSREASCNYAIGYAGEIGLGLDESMQAWTTSNRWIDDRAITVEIANSSLGGVYPVSDASLESAIALTTDICWRNGIYPCTYTGDKTGTLHKHEWYAATYCPGAYLGDKFAYIAKEVTKRLDKLRAGTTIITPIKPTVPATDGIYRVQIGAYSKKTNADAMLEKAKAKGFTDAFIMHEGNLYKVQIGAFRSRSNADGVLKIAKGLGFDTYLALYNANNIPTPETSVPATKSGSWKFNKTVKIRSVPSTASGDTQLVYLPGMVVIILDTQISGGYVWGHYISTSGSHRYVALQPVGGTAYGAWV